VRRIHTFVAIALLTIATTAHAEDIDFWNFRNQIPRETKVNNLTQAKTIPEGLHVKTDTDGFLVWPALNGPAEVLTIRARVGKPTTAYFLWQPTTPGEEGMYQIPFTITEAETNVMLSDYTFWDPSTTAIGMRFTPGSEVIIEDMTFRHWTPMEKMIESWKSFWTFDDFRAYSINFLWGPLVTGNGPAREALFDNLPPLGWSATRIFYGIFVVTGVIALFIGFILKKRSLGLGVFMTVFIFLWALFDVRMGLEILSYVYDDFTTYVTKEGEDQILRTHGNTYAVINDMLPVISKEEKFVLMTRSGAPSYPNIRYMAYPSIAVLDGQDRTGVKLWVIFDRPDFTVDDRGRLVRAADPAVFPGGKEILTGTGRIVLDYNSGTFLYREL